MSIASLEPPFQAIQLHSKHYRIKLIKEIKVRQALALVGTTIPSCHSPLESTRGRVLMEFHRSTSFDAKRDLKHLIHLLETSLGMSKSDIYGRSDIYNGEKNTGGMPKVRVVKQAEKDLFMALPQEEREAKCADFTALNERLGQAFIILVHPFP